MIAAAVHHAADAAGFATSLFDAQLEFVPAVPEAAWSIPLLLLCLRPRGTAGRHRPARYLYK